MQSALNVYTYLYLLVAKYKYKFQTSQHDQGGVYCLQHAFHVTIAPSTNILNMILHYH